MRYKVIAQEPITRSASPVTPPKFGGADRDRTGDPLLAKQVLSQLSYGPKTLKPALVRTTGHLSGGPESI